MIANDLRELRTRLGWSVAQLARHLNVEPPIVQGWERGTTFPTRRHVERLEALVAAPPPHAPPAAARTGAKGTAGSPSPQLPASALAFAALLEEAGFRRLLTRLVEDETFRKDCLAMAHSSPASATGKAAGEAAPAPGNDEARTRP